MTGPSFWPLMVPARPGSHPAACKKKAGWGVSENLEMSLGNIKGSCEARPCVTRETRPSKKCTADMRGDFGSRGKSALTTHIRLNAYP